MNQELDTNVPGTQATQETVEEPVQEPKPEPEVQKHPGKHTDGDEHPVSELQPDKIADEQPPQPDAPTMVDIEKKTQQEVEDREKDRQKEVKAQSPKSELWRRLEALESPGCFEATFAMKVVGGVILRTVSEIHTNTSQAMVFLHEYDITPDGKIRHNPQM